MSFHYVEYKVQPLSYSERVMIAAALHFDCEQNYFTKVKWEIPGEKEDEEYRYRVSLICHILKSVGLGDQSIMHCMHFKRPSQLSYYQGIIECLKPFDEETTADLKSIAYLADSLNLKTVTTPILYVSPKDQSDEEEIV